ncbi:MAG: hypothetical protein LBI41_04570 [Lactobacillales bacterium]|jgi:hypothetical protein|nr:hypothetical protein [Lactobacillales bacterium]
MKKVIQTLLLLECVIVAFSSCYIAKEMAKFQTLNQYEQQISIVDLPNAQISQKEKVAGLIKTVQKYHLKLTRVIYQSDNAKNIYTNDLSLNGWLSIPKNVAVKGDNYLANKPVNDPKKIGNIHWLSNEDTIHLYSLAGLKNLGLNGTYIIRTQKSQNLVKFIRELSENYHLSLKVLHNTSNTKEFMKAIFSLPILQISIVTLLAITVFCFLFYLIKQSKRQSLQVLHGYSQKQMLLVTFNTFKWTFILLIFLNLIILTGEKFLYKLHPKIFFYSFLSSSVVFLCLFLTLLIITLFWQQSIVYSKTLNNYVKEKNLFTPFLVISKVFALIFLFVFPYFFDGVINCCQRLYEDNHANKTWMQAKNVYQPFVAFTFHENNQSQEKEDMLFLNFYKNNYNRLALIDSSNYAVVPSIKKPLYKLNTKGKIDELTSPKGRCLEINTAYLQWNTILDKHNHPIKKEQIDFSEDSYTALVPMKLKKYEKIIKIKLIKNYQFYYVGAGRRNELEKPPKIHLIYIKNNQKYFTYASDISPETSNIITDPIVIVDIGNKSPDSYGAAITNSIFFKTKEVNAYQSIRQALSKARLLDLVPAVKSIYDERGKNIERACKETAAFLFYAILSLVTLIFCIYCFNYSLYEKKKKKIQLKILSGFSWLEICADEFFVWMFLDYAIFAISAFYNAKNMMWFLMLILTILEILVLLQMIHRKRGKYHD